MEQKTKYALIGLGTVVVVGTGAFFYLQYQKRKARGASIKDALLPENLPLPSLPSPKPNRSNVSDGFPLRKGSRGALVKDLQKALISKYGESILPRYGADGDFGAETLNALTSRGLPTIITSEIFTELIKGSSSTQTSSANSSTASLYSKLASAFHSSIFRQNFSYAIQSLKKIRDVASYSKVNAFFKKHRGAGMVRKTLVTALLDRFNTSSQKKQINAQLYRMGLKYDGSKWALSGLHNLAIDRLVTTEPTKVWDVTGKTMTVPKNTVLGEYIDGGNGITIFETLDRKRLYVKTTSISYAS
jgi:hypothetical protein